MKIPHSPHYLIVAECFGHGFGGEAKFAMLISKQLNALGREVSVFCLHVAQDDMELCQSIGINVEPGRWRRGYRWKAPEWRLSRQIIHAALRRPRYIILKLGITFLTRLLLNSPISFRLVVHDTTQASPGNKFVDKKALGKLEKCMAITASSATIKRNIRKVYNYQNPILRLPTWIDPEELGVAETLIIDDGFVCDFLYLGRLDPEKGIFELLKAFGKLLREHAGSTLTVCGLGNTLPYRMASIEEGCKGQITFTSQIDPRKIGELIRNCKWMVLPSYHEGYPLSPLESFACGRPAILTRVGSIPEMCQRSLASILVQPGDVKTLHEALIYAISEPQERYIERCIAAKQLFSKLSGIENVRKELRLLLKELEDYVDAHPL